LVLEVSYLPALNFVKYLNNEVAKVRNINSHVNSGKPLFFLYSGFPLYEKFKSKVTNEIQARFFPLK
jgi:hypothetical protein